MGGVVRRQLDNLLLGVSFLYAPLAYNCSLRNGSGTGTRQTQVEAEDPEGVMRRPTICHSASRSAATAGGPATC